MKHAIWSYGPRTMILAGSYSTAWAVLGRLFTLRATTSVGVVLLAIQPWAGAAFADDDSAEDRTTTRIGVQIHDGSGSTTWSLDGFHIAGHFKADLPPRGYGVMLQTSSTPFTYGVVLDYDHPQIDFKGSSATTSDLTLRRSQSYGFDNEFGFHLLERRKVRLTLGPSVGIIVRTGIVRGFGPIQHGEASGRQNFRLIDVSLGGQVSSGIHVAPWSDIVVTLGYRRGETVDDHRGAGPLRSIDTSSHVLFLRGAWLFGKPRP